MFYDQGSAEPGSSGAAILTLSGGEYLVRGALWGGASSCTSTSFPDYFSRFDVAYPNLRPWLEATGLPDFDVTDLWWNAQESGWGMSLTQRPNGQVFAVWYTHAADSRPLWLAMSGGRWTTGRTFTGTLYRASGPGYAQQPFDPGGAVRLPDRRAVSRSRDRSRRSGEGPARRPPAAGHREPSGPRGCTRRRTPGRSGAG